MHIFKGALCHGPPWKSLISRLTIHKTVLLVPFPPFEIINTLGLFPAHLGRNPPKNKDTSHVQALFFVLFGYH